MNTEPASVKHTIDERLKPEMDLSVVQRNFVIKFRYCEAVPGTLERGWKYL
jgi:hypothetical protein